MIKARNATIGLGLLAGLLLSTGTGLADDRMKLTGSLVGFVGNSSGVAQMGAAVLLYNRYDKLVGRTITNDKGAFGFDSLPADIYSLRVSLASFLPVVKDKIEVQPGMRSFLAVNLAGALSSIELVYTVPGQSPLMSDDWKWVLRSSLATRPVLRLTTPAGIEIRDPNQAPEADAGLFASTRGVVRVSAGDHGTTSALGNETDLGTAFALATSLFGSSELQVSGNVGHGSQMGSPSAGFRTRYTRNDAGLMSPDVQLTMRQLFLPARAGTALIGGQNGPALRTMSVSVNDSTQITDDLKMEYGFSLESVSYLERLNFFSPYARLTYDLGEMGSLQVAYSSGATPLELLQAGMMSNSDASLQHDLTALSLFPRVSLRDGRAHVQRSDNIELGYRKVHGSRTYSVSIFQENVSNAALTMAAPPNFFSSADLLPDIASNSSVFNIGSFRSRGYMASVAQNFGDFVTLSVAYGNGGVLLPGSRYLVAGDAEDMRNLLSGAQRHWASTRLSGMLPGTETRFTASYMWTDYTALTPVHTYLTQGMLPQAGLNVMIRQPLPGSSGLPGRLEATADLRNLLAQGYLPVGTGDGRRLLLIHSPRAVRGGLSFTF
ncbi:MAG: TonB-dependent receptor domain-containing protein [Bryobacteraceae bacterium]